MSAFLVSDQTINVIVAHINKNRETFAGIKLLTCKELDRVGSMLFEMNDAALQDRYGDEPAAPDYKFRNCLPPSNIQAYKSMGCLLYQCAEGDIPQTSALYAELLKLKQETGERIISEMEEYQRAKWDI